jgi:hypothetical protein
MTETKVPVDTTTITVRNPLPDQMRMRQIK